MALTAVSATCSTRPAGSISQRSLPVVTTLSGGNDAVSGAVANMVPPSVDSSVAPVAVRTMIVSPMAETRVIAVPRSATGLHHASAARAGALPMRMTVSAMHAATVAVSARLR